MREDVRGWRCGTQNRSQTRSRGTVPLPSVYSILGVTPFQGWQQGVNSSTPEGICLCPTGRWLPSVGTEFSKEKAAENDPILERSFPQAHWRLLPG